MSKKQRKKKTLKLSLVLSLILSLSILLLILYLTFDADTIQYLSTVSIRYEFFFAAIGVNALYWVAWGMRQKILSEAVNPNIKLSLVESTKIVLANLFLANITPSMAGGEPVRIHLLNKNGLSLGGATASVLSGRLLDAVFLLICVPFAFFIFWNNMEQGVLRTGLTVAILVFIIAVVLFAYAIKNPEKMKRFLIFVNNKISKIRRKTDGELKIINRINKEVDNFHDTMVFFLSEGKRTFIKAGFVTAAFWITGWMVPPLVLLGLGHDPVVIQSSAAQVLLIIIVMMPTTPGSAGVTEGGAAALYSVFIDPSLIGVFVLLFRLATYHMGLIVGAVFQYRIFKSVASFSMDAIRK